MTDDPCDSVVAWLVVIAPDALAIYLDSLTVDRVGVDGETLCNLHSEKLKRAIDAFKKLPPEEQEAALLRQREASVRAWLVRRKMTDDELARWSW